jgi:hypothetical protein
LKSSETIRSLFRRQPPPTTEERPAPTEAERRRANEAILRAQIEAEKLRAVNDIHPLF